MQFEYTGTNNLVIMQEANNYNSFLLSLILNFCPSSSDTILDIGAGIGLFAKKIKENRHNVVCFEPDASQADLLKKDGFEVKQCLDEISNESFDFLYSLNVLEHIENDEETLKNWTKKLKKDGKILIYVPAFNFLFSNMDKKVGHLRRYNIKMLTKIVLNSNLRPLKKARYADSLGFFASLLYKFINKGDGNLNQNSIVFYDKFLFPISRTGDFFFNRLFGKNIWIIAEKY